MSGNANSKVSSPTAGSPGGPIPHKTDPRYHRWSHIRKLIAINRGKTSAVLSNAEWLQILADCATIEAKVAKPIASFAEYVLRGKSSELRGIYPQAQSPVNQNKRLTAWSLWRI